MKTRQKLYNEFLQIENEVEANRNKLSVQFYSQYQSKRIDDYREFIYLLYPNFFEEVRENLEDEEFTKMLDTCTKYIRNGSFKKGELPLLGVRVETKVEGKVKNYHVQNGEVVISYSSEQPQKKQKPKKQKINQLHIFNTE